MAPASEGVCLASKIGLQYAIGHALKKAAMYTGLFRTGVPDLAKQVQVRIGSCNRSYLGQV